MTRLPSPVSRLRFLADQLADLLASVGGAGRFPIASGTVGSAIGLALYLMLPASAACQAATIALFACLGIWSAGRVARASGDSDPGIVILDEVTGMLIACFLLPKTPLTLLAAFGLFRLLDIGKWPPMRQLERLPGGFGIIADDVAAGALTRLFLCVWWRG